MDDAHYTHKGAGYVEKVEGSALHRVYHVRVSESRTERLRASEVKLHAKQLSL